MKWRPRALLEGRFEVGDRDGRGAEATGRVLDSGLAAAILRIQRFWSRYATGRLDSEDIEQSRAGVDRNSSESTPEVMLAFTLAELGRLDEASAELGMIVQSGRVTGLAWTDTRPAVVALLAQTCARVGDAERAAPIYEELLASSGHVVMFGAAVCVGAADRFLGMLAATMGRFEEAERHFEAAIELEDALGAKPHAALTRYEYARALTDRGDRSKASMLLDDSLEAARDLGMRRLERDVEKLRAGQTAR